jgi:hypothetical protein
MTRSIRVTLAVPGCRVLAAAGMAFLLACSQQTRAQTPAAKAIEPQKPAPAAPATASPQTATASPAPRQPVVPEVEPPDGKWQTDDKGRQYFVQEVPRVEGWYYWLNPEKTAVRLAYGMSFEVASYDEDSFQIRVYKVPSGAELPPSKPRREEPTAEDIEKVAATYRNETGTAIAGRLTYAPFGDGLPSRGQWRNGFKVADLNGDGHPDIVHGPPRKGNGMPVVFLGDGKGGWRRWAEVRFPPLSYDYGDVAVADFNGDGRLDLAFANHLKGFIALVADGPASFVEWGRGLDFQVPGQGGADASGFSSRTLEAADWNGDGRPDLLSLGEGPRMMASPSERPSQAYGLVVYLNQGDGSWVRKDELKEGGRAFGDDLAVADFTNDGKLDIVLGTSVMGAKDILRIGGEGGSWSRGDLPGLRSRGYVSAVDVADWNGDGRLDLTVGYLTREANVWRTGIDVYLSQAAGGWKRTGVAVEENRDWLTALDSGDLDGDGKLDLAAATGKGELLVFLGKGNGSFQKEKSPEVPANVLGCRGYDVQLVNLDDDPADELVAEFAGEPPVMFAAPKCQQEGAMMAWDVGAVK